MEEVNLKQNLKKLQVKCPLHEQNIVSYICTYNDCQQKLICNKCVKEQPHISHRQFVFTLKEMIDENQVDYLLQNLFDFKEFKYEEFTSKFDSLVQQIKNKLMLVQKVIVDKLNSSNSQYSEFRNNIKEQQHHFAKQLYENKSFNILNQSINNILQQGNQQQTQSKIQINVLNQIEKELLDKISEICQVITDKIVVPNDQVRLILKNNYEQNNCVQQINSSQLQVRYLFKTQDQNKNQFSKLLFNYQFQTDRKYEMELHLILKKIKEIFVYSEDQQNINNQHNQERVNNGSDKQQGLIFGNNMQQPRNNLFGVQQQNQAIGLFGNSQSSSNVQLQNQYGGLFNGNVSINQNQFSQNQQNQQQLEYEKLTIYEKFNKNYIPILKSQQCLDKQFLRSYNSESFYILDFKVLIYNKENILKEICFSKKSIRNKHIKQFGNQSISNQQFFKVKSSEIIKIALSNTQIEILYGNQAKKENVDLSGISSFNVGFNLNVYTGSIENNRKEVSISEPIFTIKNLSYIQQ